MLTSMTGFGKGEGSIQNMEIGVEIKSVNSRYLEIFVATPKFLSFLEEPFRKYIRQHIIRGNVHCYVNVNSANNTLASYSVNTPLLKNFMTTVSQIAKETGIEPQVNMQDLLTQPELLMLEESSIEHDVLEAEMIKILDQAIKELLDMENNEGDYIRTIFKDRMISMEKQLSIIQALQKDNIPRHIETLRSRITMLLKEDPSELQLHQEIVQLADKLDISEEIDRFQSHLKQFLVYLDSQEAVGKRLNFLLQEMNREITTMGNKASNSEISQHVVEIKNEIETVREQVQNIQ
ncbi:MAG: YicC/YloC family endoribonuclease [Candidatus Marinimicrobia bacterium]|nr:YicC/YloC family endoribonuclease [Candidatus Neomarinimicrobiota bacterium]